MSAPGRSSPAIRPGLPAPTSRHQSRTSVCPPPTSARTPRNLCRPTSAARWRRCSPRHGSRYRRTCGGRLTRDGGPLRDARRCSLSGATRRSRGIPSSASPLWRSPAGCTSSRSRRLPARHAAPPAVPRSGARGRQAARSVPMPLTDCTRRSTRSTACPEPSSSRRRRQRVRPTDPVPRRDRRAGARLYRHLGLISGAASS